MNRFSLHRDNTTQVKFAYKAQSFFSLFIEKGNTLYTLSETATWTSHYAYLLFPVPTSSLTSLTIQCCNAAKNVPQCSWFVPFCKSLFISFLTNSVEFLLCLWLITPYYLHVPLHYYHKSLPAGRKFPQATVLLTWQQFPDSSFEMLATLSAPEHKLKQQSVIFNGYLYLSPRFMPKFCARFGGGGY